MSHLNERELQNCLNCNAQVHGKYCHICGQENIEPTETVWHLVAHFFNDITHFDGKFFSTLQFLIFKPGFLSAEYKMGRRASYLNPVRMYIFTSFLFFLIFFSVFTIDESTPFNSINNAPLSMLNEMDSSELRIFIREVNKMDSIEFKEFTQALNKGKEMTRNNFEKYKDSIVQLPPQFNNSSLLTSISSLDSINLSYFNIAVSGMDSVSFNKFTKAINEGNALSKEDLANYLDENKKVSGIVFGEKYRNKAEYDSLNKAGQVEGGWLIKKFKKRFAEINEKYSNNTGKLKAILFNFLLHNFPQMLFISLPLFALFLKIIYFRHKGFNFVSHGIYSVHLYIFYFIVLLIIILLNKLSEILHVSWLQTLAIWLIIPLLFYEYKAMRNFYGQGRVKTFIKYLLAGAWRFIIVTILFLIFLFFSLLKV